MSILSNKMSLEEWIFEYAILRDATYEVKKKFSNKSIDDVLLIVKESSGRVDEDAWKNFFPSITQWVEVADDFQDLVTASSSFDIWADGELFFHSETTKSAGVHNEVEEIEVTFWGIRSEMHMKLKMKEFVDVWENGFVTEEEAFILIPERFGGEREKWYKDEIKEISDEDNEKPKNSKQGIKWRDFEESSGCILIIGLIAYGIYKLFFD
jgi:hypothetical protein